MCTSKFVKCIVTGFFQLNTPENTYFVIKS
jgi:hypothetical protein